MIAVGPEKSIVPIVRAGDRIPVKELLGTGFFVGSSPDLHVVTARHVFEDSHLEEGERYGVAFREERGIRILAIAGYRSSSLYDIAVFSGKGFPEAVPLQFADAEDRSALNVDVLAYEYSSTRIERNEANRTHISFEPLAHKGNIMRFYDSEYPESVVTPSFLTSFPALGGASGAPVVVADKMSVVGMLVANCERHLLPAQVVRYEEGDDIREEISYFLPMGKGIQASVIIELLRKLDIPVQIAADRRGLASILRRTLAKVLG